MWKKTLIIAGALVAFAVTPALSQQICAERIGILKQLDKRHKEAPQALGVTGSGQIVELLTSDRGTWTIIVTTPNGVSCLVAAGESWENIERVASNEPAA